LGSEGRYDLTFISSVFSHLRIVRLAHEQVEHVSVSILTSNQFQIFCFNYNSSFLEYFANCALFVRFPPFPLPDWKFPVWKRALRIPDTEDSAFCSRDDGCRCCSSVVSLDNFSFCVLKRQYHIYNLKSIITRRKIEKDGKI